ncbi:P-loop ATPase, Sll1717 family [Kitasatospora sp. NPDC051984]|uniref:P-loop ATPase, Sll1717 family n=1 Tax=Kitasatospora sp. NPDC051984 TaxID=3364059 RepID=UPI0037CA7934
MGQEVGLVSQLFFGRDDAENDVKDGLLKGTVFRPNYAYTMALRGRKSLIIGRKGSGKSAICRQLSTPDGHQGASVLVTPDDAAGDEIRRFELQGVTADTAKSMIWRYVFAIHAARHLTAHARIAHGRRVPPSVRALRSFLRDSGESEEAGLYDRLRRGVRGLQSANLSLKAFGVEAAFGVGASEGARAGQQLGVLEDGVAAAFGDLDCAAGHPPLLFLVDQLEQVWTADPESHALVTGLMLAAKHVTGRYHGGVRTVLFLRADIYDTLNFGEGDKFHSDEIRIEWTREGLEDVALARARASLGPELSGEQLWSVLFPASVRGEPTAEYLFRRVLPRPRDTIQLLNACQSVADERGGTTITEADVLRATEQVSRWKLQDLATEYLVSHPFLRSLFVLFENTGYVVMRSALAARFEAHREELHRAFPAYTESLTPQGVIDVLYGTSFLGVRRGGDVVYAGGAQAPPLPGEEEFHVHPCFRPALNIATPVDAGPFEPPFQRSVVVGRAGLANITAGSDAGLAINRDQRLLNELVGACERLVRQLSRSGLPLTAREEIHAQIGRVAAAAGQARQRLADGEALDVNEHVLAVSGHFDHLAAQLGTHGFADRPVTLRLTDEARALIRLVGGRGGSSDSSP